jgi:hypothetical protein
VHWVQTTLVSAGEMSMRHNSLRSRMLHDVPLTVYSCGCPYTNSITASTMIRVVFDPNIAR